MQWHMLIEYKVVNSRITVDENHNYLGTEYWLVASIKVISADRIQIQFQSGIVMEQEIGNA